MYSCVFSQMSHKLANTKQNYTYTVSTIFVGGGGYFYTN